ncbi:WG repeat-containing protein [Chryseobacterium paridis]|uniref:WG repeat-containing protein n=1 Tax=Chryseobacterium paridis TaxID=2800328 RepID=A0ABS1FQS5_9FLAO|nr:WG repeat-containing protein [Chryseobacterium paridis]MBK1894749.1 WG repeat-containing protein [Chryseobacterium paridis]
MKKLFFILLSSVCIAQQTDQYKQILLSKQLGKEVRFYSNGYGIISEAGKSTIVDSLGVVTATFPYKSEISRLAKDRFILKAKEGTNNGKIALIDSKGNQLIPLDKFKFRTWENKSRLIYSKNGKDSFYDFNGKEIIPSSDQIEFGNESRLFVKKGKDWKLYDFDGQLVSDREFDDNLRFYKGRVYIYTGVKEGEVIDYNGRTISSISNHYIDGIVSYPFLVTKNIAKDKYGIVDSNENTLAEEIYDQAFVGTEYIYLKKENTVSIFSKKDKKVYPTEFGYVNHLFGGLFRTVPDTKNPKVAIIRTSGEIVLPQEYDDVDALKISGENFVYLRKNGEETLLDKNLKNVLDEGYDIERIFSNYLILKKENVFYRFSPKDREYKELSNIVSIKPFVLLPGIIYKGKENKYGMIDEKGDEIIPSVYDDIITFLSANEVVVKKGNKFGVTNNRNEPLKEVIYDSYSSDRKGLKLMKGKSSEYLYFTHSEDKTGW